MKDIVQACDVHIFEQRDRSPTSQVLVIVRVNQFVLVVARVVTKDDGAFALPIGTSVANSVRPFQISAFLATQAPATTANAALGACDESGTRLGYSGGEAEQELAAWTHARCRRRIGGHCEAGAGDARGRVARTTGRHSRQPVRVASVVHLETQNALPKFDFHLMKICLSTKFLAFTVIHLIRLPHVNKILSYSKINFATCARISACDARKAAFLIFSLLSMGFCFFLLLSLPSPTATLSISGRVDVVMDIDFIYVYFEIRQLALIVDGDGHGRELSDGVKITV